MIFVYSIQAVSRFRHAFPLLLSGTPCDCNLLSASGAHQRTLHRKERSFGMVLRRGPAPVESRILDRRDAVGGLFTAQWAEPIMRKIDNVFGKD